MKRIAIIGDCSIGMAIHSVLNAQMSSAEIVVTQSPFEPEPIRIKAPPPMPEIRIFDTLNEGKRNRAIRREEERKKKRKR